MNFIQYITVVLLSLQPSFSDKESWEERTGRMEIVAKAIDDASSKATCMGAYDVAGCERKWPGSKKELALLLVTKGFWESRFAKNVHEGKCREYECDAYTSQGRILHKARSPWQIQRTGLVTKEEYAKMKSSTLEATSMSAEVATRYLAIGMNRCRTIKGAISIYGGVNSCDWKGADNRVKFFKALISKSEEQLMSEQAKQKLELEKRLDKKAEVSAGKIHADIKN